MSVSLMFGGAPKGGPHAARRAGDPEKSRRLLRQGGDPTPIAAFRFIHAEKANHDVKILCRMLGVSRSGYYAWRSRPLSLRAMHDAELTRRIKEHHERSRGTYGAPRILLDLRDEGYRVGCKRVARLMRQAQIKGKFRPRRRGPGRHATVHPATDLVKRNFSTDAPDRIWVADFTYWPTGEGWLYVAAVMDLFSRMIVGWSFSTSLDAGFVVDAFTMATNRRDPAPGLIHHSDQGTQYTSYRFGKRLEESGILPSMGNTGTRPTTLWSSRPSTR
jgi:putative transposase